MSQALAYHCASLLLLQTATAKDQMKTSSQVYRELQAAQFSEAQARTLVEILQAGGVVEPEPPESELDRIDQYLSAEPFQPFVIEMSSGSSCRIERRDQCGFAGPVQYNCRESQGRSRLSWVRIILSGLRRYNAPAQAMCGTV
jgi:hypothetical protein